MLLGVIEAFILHMVCNNELLRLGYEEAKKEDEIPLWMIIALFVFISIYFVLTFINKIYTVYVIPLVIAFLIPIFIEFVIRGKNKWIYIFVACFALVGVFLLGIIDVIYYPMLVVFTLVPIIMEKIVRVLYTFSLKCSNKKKNIIE